MRRFSLTLLGVATSVSLATGAEPDERYLKAVKVEDETSRRLVERIQKPGDSERERLFKRLDEVFTGRVPDDPADWFDLIVIGRSEWTRESSKYFAEFHDRVIERLEMKKGESISREAFSAYARQYLGPDSPPWKMADVYGEARGPFKHLDVNRDGFLTPEECSPGLQERFAQADTTGDGKIDLLEYQAYLRARVQYEVQTTVPLDDKQKEELKRAEQLKAQEDARPVVYHDPNKLPKEMPSWFRQLDTDQDVQVGLYEWRESKRPFAEFEAMDLNGDGLLEVVEYLRYAKLVAEGSIRPPVLRAALPDKKK
jgi:hypothetical protein